ncbi:SusE outer membrane protein domain-containing protein [Flavobacterium longum]|uniref:SusE domain-containing protein n=1 Tax=Flavobacterium longum TaxID=1299340 RepID=UPI0039E9A939
MKKIFKSVLVLSILAGLASCEEEKDLIIASPQGEFRLLTPTSGETVVLAPETPNNPGVSLSWETMDFGVQTEITYTVEADRSGDNFDTPQVVAQTTNTFASVNSSDLNGIALASELVPFEAGNLDLRVKATIGNGAEAVYSDVVTYVVTPYTTETPKMYVVGNFLNASGYGNDWTPSNAVPISASGFGQTDFEGYVYMNMSSIEYKILPTNEGWDGDYGDDGSFTGTLIQEGESNITMSGPGYFRIKATTNGSGGGTYSAQPAAWGIIGSATPTGWDSDTNMTYDATSKKWTITMNLVGGQKIKFRANDTWDLNYGDNGADGSLEEGGADIDVPASGNYTVTLDLSTPRAYTFSLQLN